MSWPHDIIWKKLTTEEMNIALLENVVVTIRDSDKTLARQISMLLNTAKKLEKENTALRGALMQLTQRGIKRVEKYDEE